MLEAVRCFDKWALMYWGEALREHARRVDRGFYANNPIRVEAFLEASAAERGVGDVFLGRCRELAAISESDG